MLTLKLVTLHEFKSYMVIKQNESRLLEMLVVLSYLKPTFLMPASCANVIASKTILY